MKNKNNGPKPASFDAVSLLNKLRSNGASNLDATDMNMLHSQVAEQSNSNARVQVQNQQLKQVRHTVTTSVVCNGYSQNCEITNDVCLPM